jgi:tryptophan halogenase
MELFQRCGRLAMQDDEHFGEESWLSLLLGQGVSPQDYDPLADVLDVEQVQDALLRMRMMVRDGVEGQPTMARFIAGYCAAGVADIGATG